MTESKKKRPCIAQEAIDLARRKEVEWKLKRASFDAVEEVLKTLKEAKGKDDGKEE